MLSADTGRVPVLQSVLEAYRFLGASWARFLPACVLVAASTGFVQASQATPAGFLLSFCVSLLVSCMFTAAVLRFAVRGEFTGPAGLAFGADELRLLGVSLGLIAVFLPPAVIAAIVIGTVFLGRILSDPAAAERLAGDPEALRAAIQEQLGPSGAMALLAVVLLFFAVFLFIAARLVMVNAATIGERRMVIFQTWRWTAGNVGRVLSAMLLTFIPVILVTSLLADLLRLAVFPGGLVSASSLQLFVYGFLIGLPGALGNLPVLGLSAFLYKGLRPPDFVPR